MKISKLTNGLLVSLLLSASVVEAESNYPAADFKPKVVFQDSDYKHSSSAPSSSKGSSVGEVSVADPDYPAANFQPEVLYKDDNYKHTKGSVSSSSSRSSSTAAEQTVSAESSSEDSSMSLILGLGILAVAGFVFYSKNAKKTAPAKRRPAPRAAAAVVSTNDGAVSGVDKYLESKVGVQPSGVEKYLDERNTSVSGVSKYVAKQKVSARLASVTGVEKYLKGRG